MIVMDDVNWKYMLLGWVGGTMFSMFAFGIGYYFNGVQGGE